MGPKVILCAMDEGFEVGFEVGSEVGSNVVSDKSPQSLQASSSEEFVPIAVNVHCEAPLVE